MRTPDKADKGGRVTPRSGPTGGPAQESRPARRGPHAAASPRDRIRPGLAALLFLALPGLGGCVVPIDPLRRAIHGAEIDGALASSGRALQPEDRLALLVPDGPDRLQTCIAAAIAERLPGGRPVPAAPEAGSAGRIVATMTFRTTDEPSRLLLREEVRPPAAASLGADWLVLVENRSSVVPEGGGVPVYGGRSEWRRLSLRAVVFDLRAGARLGAISATLETRRGGAVVGGAMIGGGVPIPFLLPGLAMPAGSSPRAVCADLGRAVGEAMAALR